MRQIINGIIYNESGNILVVDKPKEDGKILTIFPGGKKEDFESDEETLEREIEEELGLNGEVLKYLFKITGITPTSKIESEIKIYISEIIDENFKTNKEIRNPRFLSPIKILNLETTTNITREIVRKLINKNKF